ncbi:hypothetical protein PVAND_017810 [Polypedilum vanderplanki]|uniref:NACHT domain-containing protein n=1 Tax=Polypedilum vanderplanki TaxID=319348 RepID=A0A9J6B937_POLVA|nr:hypothetical protein PVAND_017810 [Polypedilum vanderplanki]
MEKSSSLFPINETSLNTLLSLYDEQSEVITIDKCPSIYEAIRIFQHERFLAKIITKFPNLIALKFKVDDVIEAAKKAHFIIFPKYTKERAFFISFESTVKNQIIVLWKNKKVLESSRINLLKENCSNETKQFAIKFLLETFKSGFDVNFEDDSCEENLIHLINSNQNSLLFKASNRMDKKVYNEICEFYKQKINLHPSMSTTLPKNLNLKNRDEIPTYLVASTFALPTTSNTAPLKSKLHSFSYLSNTKINMSTQIAENIKALIKERLTFVSETHETCCKIFIDSNFSWSQIHQFYALKSVKEFQHLKIVQNIKEIDFKEISNFGLIDFNSNGEPEFFDSIYRDFFIAKFIKDSIVDSFDENLEKLIVKVKVEKEKFEFVIQMLTEMMSDKKAYFEAHFLDIYSWDLLTEEKQEILKNAKILLNDEEVTLRSHPGIYKALTSNQIYQLLNGKILNFEKKSSIQKSSEEKTDLEIDEHYDSRSVVKVKALKPRGKRPVKTKISKTYDELTEIEKQKVFASTVSFQGFEVNFGDLIYHSEKHCKNLSPDDIDKMLKGEIVSFFSPLKRSPENYIERKFKRNRSNVGSDDEEDEQSEDDDYYDHIKIKERRNNDDDDDSNGNDLKKSQNHPCFKLKESRKAKQNGSNQGNQNKGNNNNGTTQSYQSSSTNDPQPSTSKAAFFCFNRRNQNEEDENIPPNDNNNNFIKSNCLNSSILVDDEDDYKINPVLTYKYLENLANEEKFILIGDSPGCGKTATLLNVYMRYKKKLENSKIIPFVFYIDFGNEETFDTISSKIYDLLNITCDDTVSCLQKLNSEFDNKYKFTNELFRDKFNRGHVIFLWDEVEYLSDLIITKNLSKRDYLLNLIRIIKVTEVKNLQWVVSNKEFVKKREIFFNCFSFRFLRISNENSLQDFYDKLKMSQSEAENVNENLIFKFQRFIEEKNEFSSFNMVKEFTIKMLEFGSIFKTFNCMYENFHLSENDSKLLRFLTIKSVFGDNFKSLYAMRLKVNSMSDMNLKKLGILRKSKVTGSFEVAREWKMFVIAKYLVENILNLVEDLWDGDENEVRLRLKLLLEIAQRKDLKYARKILIDYLLLNVENDEIHEFFVNAVIQEPELKNTFDELKNNTKIFILHLFAKNSYIFNYLSKIQVELAIKLRRFINNEKQKYNNVTEVSMT